MYQVAAKNASVPQQRGIPRKSVDRPVTVWIIVASVLFSSILCVWSRAKVTTLGYEISQETRRLKNQSELNEQLRAEVAMLKAPGRLEPIAKEELGLRPPKNRQIVFMK